MSRWRRALVTLLVLPVVVVVAPIAGLLFMLQLLYKYALTGVVNTGTHEVTRKGPFFWTVDKRN